MSESGEVDPNATSTGEDVDFMCTLDETDPTGRYDAAMWLRKRVGVVVARDLPAEPSEEDCRQGLRSGILLCKVLNKIKPGAVPKVVNAPSPVFTTPDSDALAAYLENIKSFLVAVEDLGLPTFEPSDLEPGGDFLRVVNTVLAMRAYNDFKAKIGDGSRKFSWSSPGGEYSRRKSAAVMSGMSINSEYSWGTGDQDDDESDPTDECEVGPLYSIVSDLLMDREEEDIPIIIENILKKLKEEFESRLAEETKKLSGEADEDEETSEDEAAREEEERIQREKELQAELERARKQQEEEERAAREEEERLQREREIAAEKERIRKQQEEAERAAREAAERAAREAAERAARETAERAAREAAERAAKEAAERAAREAAERAREEAERAAKEAAERAAREAAERAREEAERAAKEEQERILREQQEQEQEQARIERENRRREAKEKAKQQRAEEKRAKKEQSKLEKDQEKAKKKEEKKAAKELERMNKEKDREMAKKMRDEDKAAKEQERIKREIEREQAKKIQEANKAKKEKERLKREQELKALQEKASQGEAESLAREKELLALQEKARKEAERERREEEERARHDEERERQEEEERARLEEIERQEEEERLREQEERERQEEDERLRLEEEREMQEEEERARLEEEKDRQEEEERIRKEEELARQEEAEEKARQEEEERAEKEKERLEREEELREQEERARKQEDYKKRMNLYTSLNANTAKKQGLVERQEKDLQELRGMVSTAKTEVHSWQENCKDDGEQLGGNVRTLCQAAAGYNKVLEENRNLYNQVQDLKGSIRVYCRLKPFPPGQEDSPTTVEYRDEETVVLLNSKGGKETRKASMFNKVFGPASTQEEVFTESQPLIRSVLDGFNVCIFAYGQTGAGKTYTLTGPKDLNEETMGVNLRALNDLFLIAEERHDLMAYTISINILEIYNDEIRDLLVPDGSNKIIEISASKKGINVPDATLVPVASTDEVINQINLCRKNRAANDHSSRSHTFLTTHVFGKDLTSGSTVKGCMHLVDLAGSENIQDSDDEASHISKSLSALGDLLIALATKAKNVPFKACKLTHLLQDAIGAQAKILMFVQLNTDVDEIQECLNTFKFIERFSTVEGGCGKTAEVRDLKEQYSYLKTALAKIGGGGPLPPQEASVSAPAAAAAAPEPEPEPAAKAAPAAAAAKKPAAAAAAAPKAAAAKPSAAPAKKKGK